MMTLSVEYEMPERCRRHQQPGPERCYRRLVPALVLWLSILTTAQLVSIAVYLTFYLTAGPNTSTPSPDRGPLVFEVNAEAQERSKNNVIYWKTQSRASPHGYLNHQYVTIKRDGCYFLYVQVSLCVMQRETSVRVEQLDGHTLLEGRLSNSTLSSGFLGRVVALSRYDTLVVKMYPDVSTKINTTEQATYMGIYWVAP